jgi:hypothetical protein
MKYIEDLSKGLNQHKDMETLSELLFYIEYIFHDVMIFVMTDLKKCNLSCISYIQSKFVKKIGM